MCFIYIYIYIYVAVRQDLLLGLVNNLQLLHAELLAIRRRGSGTYIYKHTHIWKIVSSLRFWIWGLGLDSWLGFGLGLRKLVILAIFETFKQIGCCE